MFIHFRGAQALDVDGLLFRTSAGVSVVLMTAAAIVFSAGRARAQLPESVANEVTVVCEAAGACKCGNGQIDPGEQCDQGNLNGGTCDTATSGSKPYGTLSCSAGCVYDTAGCTSVRFVDNGDGTISDNKTGLMWEKKSGDGSIHDEGNFYTWSSSGTAPDGSAFTTFLTTLNNCTSGDGSTVSGGFAGHCDWRLPQIDELATISNTSCATAPCVVDPVFNTNCTSGCTVTTCSCTLSSDYWSASTYSFGTGDAWVVYFGNGFGAINFKTRIDYVRAVRGGSGE